jgi:hypothetical protein
VVAIVTAYGEWLATSSVPKLGHLGLHRQLADEVEIFIGGEDPAGLGLQEQPSE